MRAKLVHENIGFKRGRDPYKSLGIGYGKKRLTKGWKILEFIKESGNEGRSLIEIQHFIWTELQGYDPDEFWKKESYNNLRKSRGYYCTNLYGSGGMFAGSNEGLLIRWCKKNDKGKWIIDKWPKPGDNLYLINESKLVSKSLNDFMNI